jgi:5-oxoprolinase (ATP-hydrolysing) subunit C
VLKPGLQTTIQSRPRVGMRHLGVPAGGAADALSMALANRLVGNTWYDPVLEATLLGPTLRFESPCSFALAGAHVTALLNGEDVPMHATVRVEPGDALEIGPMTVGARVYVAVAGGLEADEVLGSRSTNLQAGFGGLQGRALAAGDEIYFPSAVAESCETPEEFRLPMSSSWAVRVCPSVETGQLDAAGQELLFGTNWTISRRADRMGLQLDGPTLGVSSDGRMPSAGVFPGTVQCPEDGTPYLLSVDAGTVGGYPRIAQVARVDRHLLGQLRPGDHLCLLLREPDEAIDALHAKIDYWRAWLPDIEEVLR